MITLIVVDYKSPTATVEYIKSLKAADTKCAVRNILVVDNSNTDCWNEFCLSQGLIIEEVPGIEEKYCKRIFKLSIEGILIYCAVSADNLGYAKGNNLGARLSEKLWGDKRFLLSNNDLEFPENIDFEKFENILNEHCDVAVVGPMVKSPKGVQQSPHKKASIFKALIFRYPALLLGGEAVRLVSDVVKTDRTGECYWVTGCFMYVDALKFKECGMFDEETFLYGEEKILAERLLKKDYKMYFLADEVIIHNHGQSVKKAMSLIKEYEYGIKSQLYYFKEYRGTCKINLSLAMLSFGIYKNLVVLKEMLKRKLKK